MLAGLWKAPPRKRRRTGGRQDAAARDAEGYEEGEGCVSKLAAGLLLQWADGESSADKVRYHMANAKADNFAHPMIDTLAKLREGCKAAIDLQSLLESVGLVQLQTNIDGPQKATCAILPSTLVR